MQGKNFYNLFFSEVRDATIAYSDNLEYFSINERSIGAGSYFKWPQYEEFTFCHRGEISEMGNENFVPVDLAREAVREFYLTRKRPTIIKWGSGGVVLE
jgi:hypothetical protein